MTKTFDIGQRFGRLTIISEAPSRKVTGGSKRMVVARCDCGTEKEMQLGNLRAGNSTTCGRCPDRGESSRFPPGVVGRNLTFAAYRRRAHKFEVPFDITVDDFEQISGLPCAYCGAEPGNRLSDRNGEGKFTYNGLDRVEPKLGYTLTNIVPACIVCNRAKSDQTLEEFRSWVERVFSRL